MLRYHNSYNRHAIQCQRCNRTKHPRGMVLFSLKSWLTGTKETFAFLSNAIQELCHPCWHTDSFKYKETRRNISLWVTLQQPCQISKPVIWLWIRLLIFITCRNEWQYLNLIYNVIFVISLFFSLSYITQIELMSHTFMKLHRKFWIYIESPRVARILGNKHDGMWAYVTIASCIDWIRI